MAVTPLVGRLVDAFFNQKTVEPLASEVPRDVASAEAIQDAIAASLGTPAAYKLGATIPAVQQTLGLPGAFFGPIPPSRVFADGASLGPVAARQRGVESEYAFRLSRDIAAGETLTEADLPALFPTIHPSIEIPGTRFAALGAHGGFALMADAGAVGALVLGPAVPVTGWASLDTQPVILEVEGEAPVNGGSAGIGGGAAGPLLAFLRAALRRGYPLRAGQVVATGSCTGYVTVPPGRRVTARFPALGAAVSCSFTDKP